MGSVYLTELELLHSDQYAIRSRIFHCDLQGIALPVGEFSGPARSPDTGRQIPARGRRKGPWMPAIVRGRSNKRPCEARHDGKLKAFHRRAWKALPCEGASDKLPGAVACLFNNLRRREW